MKTETQYQLKAKWNGGLRGVGRLESGTLETHFSVPKNLTGPGVGSNPEELILSAVGSCYLITLATILEKREIPVAGIQLSASATIQVQGGLRLKEIQIRVSLDTEDARDFDPLFQIAKAHCLISNALQGNVVIEVRGESHQNPSQTHREV